MPLQIGPEGCDQGAEQDPVYEQASRLPVLDAAYHLWQAKRRLDAREGRPLFTKIEPTPDVSQPGVLRDLLASTVKTLNNERQSAAEGPTLDRLLMVHPETTREEAQDAIRRAVNLEDAGRRTLRSLGGDPRDVWRAMEMTREANPGFSNKTYNWLSAQLSYEACK
jgi:hypothetical protein